MAGSPSSGLVPAWPSPFAAGALGAPVQEAGWRASTDDRTASGGPATGSTRVVPNGPSTSTARPMPSGSSPGSRASCSRAPTSTPTPAGSGLADYVAAWQKAQVHRPTTEAQVDAHLRNHSLPTFGERAVASIRPSEIQAWVRSRAEVLAPATVELVYRIFSGILADVVADRLLARNPARGVRLPRKPKRPIEPPTLDRVEAVIAAIPDRYRALVVLAAGTGLRQGECFGLTVDRVDFLRRSITVDRQLVLAGSGPLAFGPPKTEASTRSVPLPDVVGEALAGHLERWPPGPDSFIFTNSNGGPIRRNRFNELWRSATHRAGVEGLRFHDLRHFYASLLIAHGESVKVVQARLGHASASETLDTYAHLWPITRSGRVRPSTASLALVSRLGDGASDGGDFAASWELLITMYSKDHAPPISTSPRVSITRPCCSTGRSLRDRRRLLRRWAKLHQEELAACWNRASRRQPPGTIDPLP
jgi:integrase